ncbi:stage III sporulation protein AF [Dysosmobacter sp.]
MIGAVREWLTALVVVSMLLSAVQALIPEGSLRRIASFTGGLVLLTVLLRPALGERLQRLELPDYAAEVAERQEELERAGNQELSARIAERTQAYISDKAASLGLSGSVQVETKENEEGLPLPWSVRLALPESETMAAWIEGELGIPRERQVWYGGKGEN